MISIKRILRTLRRSHAPTMLEKSDSPFTVLVSTVLSARAKDTATIPIANRLFRNYKTPKDFDELPLKRLEKLVYGTGFYRQKAKYIKALSRVLLEKHGGKVPRTFEELIALPGVGRKTANCVLVYAFRKPAIPVDVHVHRVSNRLGIVCTKKPEETEIELMRLVPKKYWIDVNELLVGHGQTVCVPVSPFCSKCTIVKLCKRAGVKKSR